MKVEMVKHLGGLRPVDDAGQQLLASLKHGQSVMVEVKRPRNILHHRKLFALLNVVQPNTSYPNVYALLKALQVYCGYCDLLPTRGGKVATVPKSIAFENMDQAEFEPLYADFERAIVEKFLPGVTSEQLRAEVEAFLAPRAA